MLVPGGEYRPLAMQTAAVATGNGTAIPCTDGVLGAYTALVCQVAGVTSATLTFEATVDGTNWVALQATNLNDGNAATTATANGLYRMTVLGLAQVRARISTYSSGTINVTGLAVA